MFKRKKFEFAIFNEHVRAAVARGEQHKIYKDEWQNQHFIEMTANEREGCDRADPRAISAGTGVCDPRMQGNPIGVILRALAVLAWLVHAAPVQCAERLLAARRSDGVLARGRGRSARKSGHRFDPASRASGPGADRQPAYRLGNPPRGRQLFDRHSVAKSCVQGARFQREEVPRRGAGHRHTIGKDHPRRDDRRWPTYGAPRLSKLWV